jgi:flavorubredoxin
VGVPAPSTQGRVRPREIAPDLYWIGGCLETDAFEGNLIHIHQNCLLVLGERETLLFETSHPVCWPTLTEQLDRVLGERPLNWIAPSHPEIAHAGNLGRLLRKYPNARAIGDIRDYHLYLPDLTDRFERRLPGDRIDLGGGNGLTILQAPILDAPNTIWAFADRQKVMCTADGFGYSHHPQVDDDAEVPVHRPGECALYLSELPALPDISQAAFITKAALYWTRFVPIAPFLDGVKALLDKYSPQMLVPTHGNLVDDIDQIMPIIEEAHRLAYEESAQFLYGAQRPGSA